MTKQKIEFWEIEDTSSDGYGKHLEFVHSNVSFYNVYEYAKYKYALPQDVPMMAEVKGWTNRGIGVQLFTKEYDVTDIRTVKESLPKLKIIADLQSEQDKLKEELQNI
jgi:hypothetical protein